MTSIPEMLLFPPDSLVDLQPDEWTRPFWDAAARQELACAVCAACGTYRMPPAPFCHRCRSQEMRWEILPGTGTVFSYTVVWRAVVPELAESVPYAIAVVTLDGADGVRIVTNIVDAVVAELSIGARVHVVWREVSPDVVVPRFAPIV